MACVGFTKFTSGKVRMKKISNIFLNLIRIALGLIFIYAAIPKILNPNEFSDAVNNYRILPYFLVNIVAICLPWVELLFGVFLVIGIRLKAASFGVLLLMVLFIIAIASAWIRGININCGCFGLKEEIISIKEIMRDILFLLMALITFIKTPKWQTS